MKNAARTRAFSDEAAPGIGRAVVAFAHFARGHGLNVGVQEVIDALEAGGAGVLQDKAVFRHALRALFCCQREDRAVFDRLFDQFWDTEAPVARPRRKMVNKSMFVRNQQASLVLMGQGHTEGEEDEGKNVTGANAVDRLRKTDFSKVSEMDSELLEELAMRLWKEMSRRLRRRLRASTTQGRIDLRRTIRRSISRGGDPIELMRRRRRPRRQRLVVLLDVSGSMDKYSFFLLRFIYALQEHFEQLEAFTFSTELRRVTPMLRAKGLDATLRLLSEQNDTWSSGTRIGACLESFVERYAKRTLSGNALVIILSDGLDTGEPEQLAAAMEQISLRARRIVWLNPLKGMHGYEPTARGMSAALPLVDNFSAAHNLDSLLELENLLIHV